MSSQLIYKQSLFTTAQTIAQPSIASAGLTMKRHQPIQSAGVTKPMMNLKQTNGDRVSTITSASIKGNGAVSMSSQSMTNGISASGFGRMPNLLKNGTQSISSSYFGHSNAQFMSRASVVSMALGSSNEFQSRIQDQLTKAIKTAESTQKGTAQSAQAWEVVEELDQTLSHLRSKNLKTRDSKDVAEEVNQYLESHPDAVEQFERQNEPVVSGDLPSNYLDGYGYSDYVDMEDQVEEKNEISNDPRIRQIREQLNIAYAEAVEAQTKKIVLASVQGPSQSQDEHVVNLWAIVEELESAISHLKQNLKSKVPREINDLRQKIEKQATFAKSQLKGSIDSKLAYEDLEEMDAALSKLTNARKPKQTTDMRKVDRDIKQYTMKYKQFIVPEMTSAEMELIENVDPYNVECDFEEMLSVDDRIDKCRIELTNSIEYAMSTQKGTAKSAQAWDAVEELEAEISHLKSRC